jgi:hypothetical protein
LFKTCTMCLNTWTSRDEFLDSPQVGILGYQACLKKPPYGLFLFNHETKDCGSTLAIEVSEFVDLYTGPHYTEPKIGTEACGGHCHNQFDLENCNAPCAYAFIRALIQILKARVPHAKT